VIVVNNNAHRLGITLIFFNLAFTVAHFIALLFNNEQMVSEIFKRFDLSGFILAISFSSRRVKVAESSVGSATSGFQLFGSDSSMRLIVLGSGKSMKTPTDCCGSIYPKESTCKFSVKMS
jgi:hypothetical protein